MTLFFTPYSTQRAIVIGCVVIALLALPFIGMAHCEVAHAVDGHAPAPLAEACCVFVCLTMLISALALHRGWMLIDTRHVRFDAGPSCQSPYSVGSTSALDRASFLSCLSVLTIYCSQCFLPVAVR